MGLFNFLTQEIAIDLGTANTLIISEDKVVVDEPSIVALDKDGNVIAVGKKAMQMHGKTHNDIKTVRPLKDGVIADFEAAEMMIKEMIKMINPGNKLIKPSLVMVICIPSGITEVEKKSGKRLCGTRQCQKGLPDTRTDGGGIGYRPKCARA